MRVDIRFGCYWNINHKEGDTYEYFLDILLYFFPASLLRCEFGAKKVFWISRPCGRTRFQLGSRGGGGHLADIYARNHPGWTARQASSQAGSQARRERAALVTAEPEEARKAARQTEKQASASARLGKSKWLQNKSRIYKMAFERKTLSYLNGCCLRLTFMENCLPCFYMSRSVLVS